jgi:hypothetical protein
VTRPERFSWADPLTVQSSGRDVGILSLRVSGVRPVNRPLLEPAPNPLLQTIVQFPDTLWLGRARTRIKIARGFVAWPLTSAIA